MTLAPASRETATLNRFAAVIVTGGSSGIGNEFLKTITTVCKCSVICNLSRSKPANFPVAANHHHIACDLANIEALPGIVETIERLLATAPEGPLLLINNGGVGTYGAFPEPSLAATENMIAVNMTAPVKLTALLWPMLQKRTGWIINIASISAFQPVPLMATYSATKAFLLHWSLGLDVEGRAHGIRSLAVCPGTTQTNFFNLAKMQVVPSRYFVQSAAQVVHESLRALAREKSLLVCGWANRLAMFFSARLPKPWTARLAHAEMRKRGM